jgi:hypothetical protein
VTGAHRPRAPRAARSGRSAPATSPVVLRGTPSALSVAFDAPPKAAADGLAVAADLPGVDVERVRFVRRRNEPSTVRMRLAATTPPGTYTGQVTVGATTLPVVAEVGPRPRLRAEPTRLVLAAAAGAVVRQEVRLTNAGNVACSLPERSRVGLLADGAWGEAFWYAIGEPGDRGVRRLERFVDGLAERAAGLAEVRVRRGLTIEPGASAQVEVTIGLPDGLEAGRTYHGTWEPEGLRLGLRVTGETPARTPRRGGRR